ncbi:sensor histidine kinase [Parabacteroides pacaensis]|uniref:sensor histidine kinase n=1 Tax=Parabacteroides pacaensis TaxID=2086575 RepID=UPI000D10551D|nr:ATP-binding protein [Parabacteroides pacaensis]
MLRFYFQTLTLLLLLLLGSTVGGTYFAMTGKAAEAMLCGLAGLIIIVFLYKLYNRNARKVAFMFDAIDNDDYTFKFPPATLTKSDNKVNLTLNRIKDILLKAKADAIEKEKYHEIILNCVNTGILVVDDKGYVFQTNNEAHRLLGLSVLTHLAQLKKLDEKLPALFSSIKSGEKLQTSFSNERDHVHLAVRASSIILRNKHFRIIAINDINKELDEKEIDSWIRLIRVLTHEIMNSVTPITSISDTLLELHSGADEEIRHGLEVISTTGKNLISFVESYRRFTRIPIPEPTLFYVGKFISRMVELAQHNDHYPNITIETDVRPADLIIYADEKLISQVMLNLLKNAMQAIGPTIRGGEILIKAYCNADEEVLVEVSNNGPLIPEEIADHIFIPFFTTKERGSGIGLSISRQIMRLSGGSITLKTSPVPANKQTTFVLTFK